MPDCSFCGTTEKKEYPLCHSCGAIRYPVEKSSNIAVSRQQKLKLSASVAAAIVTPGAFVVLALVGAKHFNAKLKNQKF
ncbi:hypothetical protein BJAS_P0104 [Bathymodiolus japonicus methanotrophic gill symbiont]|uniref:hypothetical protein n=1 Tax=Bathymodiolus japonicus methanotrophic gill symbiont TaxID=113269 RepID=UPI001B6AA1EF|nr:hypothetical protein [Bathymodiolus japonicus methanotrophic gill symbiont]GFO70952.1 hypothetical protein BJAS_P0104 [Bathymodiolus japonicus methanotrophic gill symbiont]